MGILLRLKYFVSLRQILDGLYIQVNRKVLWSFCAIFAVCLKHKIIQVIYISFSVRIKSPFYDFYISVCCKESRWKLNVISKHYYLCKLSAKAMSA